MRKLATGTMVWDRVTNSCAPASVLVIDELVISSQCGQNLAEALKANHLTTGARAWSRPGAWQIHAATCAARPAVTCTPPIRPARSST